MSPMFPVATALHDSPEPIRTIGLLVAYTGARPATWTDAKWSEVDLKRALLTVSRSRGRTTKLGRGWAVPLPKQAVVLLQVLRKSYGRHPPEYVFGRRVVIEQKQRDRLAKLAGMTDPKNRGSLHRWRSTFLLTLNQWGVPLETQLVLAGHANLLAGSRAYYVVPMPSRAQRDVMQRYEDWLIQQWLEQ
jgi:integrase